MSELKDEVTEKFVESAPEACPVGLVETSSTDNMSNSIAYTLDQCVDAYDPENLTKSKAESKEREDGLNVITPGEYYGHRFMRCAVDTFAIIACAMIFGCLIFAAGFALIAAFSAVSQSTVGFLTIFTLPVTLFMVTFCVKWLSSVKDYAGMGLRVVTRDGRPIGVARAAIRSLVFCYTWFLFPVHLVLVAVGSRRFLHDLMTDTYVLLQGEVPEQTIYPPAPRWIAPTLVVICVSGVLLFAEAKGWICSMETSVVGTVLGVDSRFYLHYLHWRYDRSPVRLTYMVKTDAEKLLPYFVKMTELDVRYEGPATKESAGDIFKSALVATQACQPALADKYLEQFLRLPESITADAFSLHHGESYFGGEYPKLMAANLYRLNGRLETALSLALSEKKDSFDKQQPDRFKLSTKLLVLIYRTKVALGAKDADYSKLLRKEERDLSEVRF